MNKEYHQIFEAYANNRTVVNEGILDRLKARGSEMKAAAKQLPTRAGAALKGAKAGFTGDIRAGREAITAGRQAKAQSELAKIESYRKTATQKFSKVSSEVENDLRKLGISLEGVGSASSIFSSALDQAFNNLINQVKTKSGMGIPMPSSGAPSPAAPKGPGSSGYTWSPEAGHSAKS